MNKLAQDLNQALEGTIIADLLSDYGRRFYFPAGIIKQSAEASAAADRHNATVGIATAGKQPLCLPSLKKLLPDLSSAESFAYAPTAGLKELRELWAAELIDKNPGLKDKSFSLPMVTAGLTHGISLLGDLFVDAGDTVIVPDLFWGNYRLIFAERNRANLVCFEFFDQNRAMNLAALGKALEKAPAGKAVLVLNFPNNPTGYSPTQKEMADLKAMLLELAEAGRKLLVVGDDAYFGLFYEQETEKQSLFAHTANLHPNLLAVKLDAATKEELVWGFRVGFMTYGFAGGQTEHYQAIMEKTGGSIRAGVSSCSRLGQSLLIRALKDERHKEDKKNLAAILAQRYQKVRSLAAELGRSTPLKPLPFNSGYFMTFLLEGKSAEELRKALLAEHQVGVISIQDKYIRLAYSSVDLDRLDDLFSVIGQAAGDL